MPKPSDVAILFRRNRNTHVFKEALMKAGWKCQLATGNNPFDYAEIKGLLSAFRYLGGVDEELSLVGSLRSPLGPVDDETLLSLTRPPESKICPLSSYFKGESPWPSSVTPQQTEILETLRNLYKRLKPLMGRLGPVEILETIIEERKLIPLAMLQADGPERVRAMQGFLAASRQIGLGCEHNPQSEAEELTTLWEEGASLINIGGHDNFADDAIKMMTIHGAKGLEFPVVVVAEADYCPKTRAPMLAVSDGGAMALRFKGANFADVRPPDYEEIIEKNNQLDSEEELRLFYVAATRAQDHLILLGWPKGKSKSLGRVSWFDSLAASGLSPSMVGALVYEVHEGGGALLPENTSALGIDSLGDFKADFSGFAKGDLSHHFFSATFFSRFLIQPQLLREEYFLGFKSEGEPPIYKDGPQDEGGGIQPINLKAKVKGASELSAAARGNLFHRVLEKIDLDSPQIKHLVNCEAQLGGLNLSKGEEDDL
ncbi:MAG: 3'-5' exonuclease, partial [Candidatus Adiutrix sp.]